MGFTALLKRFLFPPPGTICSEATRQIFFFLKKSIKILLLFDMYTTVRSRQIFTPNKYISYLLNKTVDYAFVPLNVQIICLFQQ